MTHSPVADSVSGSITTGLQKFHFSQHPAIPTQVSPVGDELCHSAGGLIFHVGSHHSTPSSASLAKSSWADSVQVGCS